MYPLLLGGLHSLAGLVLDRRVVVTIVQYIGISDCFCSISISVLSRALNSFYH